MTEVPSEADKQKMFEANRRAHQWLRLDELDDDAAIAELRAGFTPADYVWVTGILTALCSGLIRSLADKADQELVDAHRELVERQEYPAGSLDWEAMAELGVAIAGGLAKQYGLDPATRVRLYEQMARASYEAADANSPRRRGLLGG